MDDVIQTPTPGELLPLDGELQSTVGVEVDRPFLSTPLSDYTVSEGLLLLLVLLVLLGGIIKLWQEVF